MAPRGFDHFMLHIDTGRNLKLGRLTPAERCAWVLGVLPIAARAPMRGAFMVGHLEGVSDDVAAQANVPSAVATSMLRKVRALGMLERDDDLGAEWVHDFEEHNPEPKTDATAPERAKRYRERQKAKRNAPVTSHRDDRDANSEITPPEVEVEEERNNPPTPASGGAVGPEPIKPTSGRQRDQERYAVEHAAWLHTNLAPASDGDLGAFDAGMAHLRGIVSEGEFGSWLSPLALAGRIGDQLVLSAPSEVIEWIRSRFDGALRAAFGGEVRLLPSSDLTVEQRAHIHDLGQRMRQINTEAAA